MYKKRDHYHCAEICAIILRQSQGLFSMESFRGKYIQCKGCNKSSSGFLFDKDEQQCWVSTPSSIFCCTFAERAMRLTSTHLRAHPSPPVRRFSAHKLSATSTLSHAQHAGLYPFVWHLSREKLCRNNTKETTMKKLWHPPRSLIQPIYHFLQNHSKHENILVCLCTGDYTATYSHFDGCTRSQIQRRSTN